jgi:hypothetical protein
MTVTVRRRYNGPRVHEERKQDRKGEVHKLIARLVELWGEDGRSKAVNVAWWRYRHHLSLQVRKVLP